MKNKKLDDFNIRKGEDSILKINHVKFINFILWNHQTGSIYYLQKFYHLFHNYMPEDATLKLYIFFGERNNQGKRKKIKVEDFGLYLKNNHYVDYGIGHTIIRYQKQKMEFDDFENKLITKIIEYIPRMYLKSEFYASDYSEINTGAELYIHFSSINQVVKIAYLDTRIKDALRTDFQDYQSTAMRMNSCIERGCTIYTKEFIKKNNLTHSYSGENGG